MSRDPVSHPRLPLPGTHMRTLIVGTGVMATIYGWALSEAVVDVTHVVRHATPRAETVKLDLLDARPARWHRWTATYTPRVVKDISPIDKYELVIVATRQDQVADAVRQYQANAPGAIFLILAANWRGTAEIDHLLPRRRCVWGYPASRGGRADGRLLADVRREVHLGLLEGSDPRDWKRCRVYSPAPPLSWIARTTSSNGSGSLTRSMWATAGVALAANGVARARYHPALLHRGVLASREALGVVAARGVALERYPDARRILRTPPWMASAGRMAHLTLTPRGRRLVETQRRNETLRDMRRACLDVLRTGTELGVPVPHLRELCVSSQG